MNALFSALASLFLCGVCSPMMASDDDSPWKAFDYPTLLKHHANVDDDYLRFINRPTMSMGLYRLTDGAKDKQQPHKYDEVYYVVKGSADLKIENKRFPVQKESVAFVRAGVMHRFVELSEDFQVLVIFSLTESDPQDQAVKVVDLQTVRAEAKNDENVWSPFINVYSMRFGLYMLPEALGGDSTLTHKVDEVNIVVKGTARFRMDEDEIDVEPGSIIFVRSGIGHYFHDLSENFEVLILFEKSAS